MMHLQHLLPSSIAKYLLYNHTFHVWVVMQLLGDNGYAINGYTPFRVNVGCHENITSLTHFGVASFFIKYQVCGGLPEDGFLTGPHAQPPGEVSHGGGFA